MASQMSTGSPRAARKSTPTIVNNDNQQDDGRTPRNRTKVHDQEPSHPQHGVTRILNQLRLNDSRKIQPTQSRQQDHLDKVMANLTDQNRTLKQQQMDLKDDSDCMSYKDPDRSSGSELFTPATDTFENGVNDEVQAPSTDAAEIMRIKQELAAAKSVISRQELELAESRNLRHTMEQATEPASDPDYPANTDAPRFVNSRAQSAFNASARPFTSYSGFPWQPVNDGKADLAATLMNTGMNTGINRGRNWNHNQAALSNNTAGGYQAPSILNNYESRYNGLGFTPGFAAQTSPTEPGFPRNRNPSSGSSNISYGIEDRFAGAIAQAGQQSGFRRPVTRIQTNSTLSDPLTPISPISAYGQTLVDPIALSSLAGVGHYNHVERHGNSQTSPIGTQFTTSPGHLVRGDVNLTGNALNNQSYVLSTEPMNYRRLLDKSVSCDWKYIVDKIVCNNDQQASIFLQQKLKVGTAEQKYDIVKSIVNQAYPLMINRFGNFLVQRCFEHGTPDQIDSIAQAIHGSVISLSMDPFGCHVIQKAFDAVPEDHKAHMVRELLSRIPDTVIHRYACHVWQKLFELRWSGEPPQIMVKVNEALQGMWHEVALGETGSLVVQNIFENCVEEEKRPAIEEVISNIDLVAHGQFGNWCIQHLCEHGSPPDKRRVIDHILNNSYSYSVDQFASKVVEKCLKIGGSEFLDRYLGVITTARPDRPRIPLIDISGDQYGNYLIQWILMNTHQHQREQVAIHIRKHMVSLRGSKFGSRVAMLCSNPASATRPGVASALVNPYGAQPQQRLGGRYR